MEKENILVKVKEQFAKDYNCAIEDFDNNENLITDLKVIDGSRKYNDDKDILKVLVFNGKIVMSADRCIKEWCKENFEKFPGEWLFLYSVLRRIDKKLNEFGYEIEDTHHYYLPKEYNYEEPKNVKLKWYEKDNILQFKGDDRFDEAFAFNKNYPDILAVAAVDDKGDILGMAGASEDSNIMWQIGVNVLPEAKNKGVASIIVQSLKNEILRRGKVPFYGTVESHIVSQKLAIKSGFYPAFGEIKIRKIQR
ncbi:GNAT family N-acetyltransferase [Clostridium sp. AL.422]|uniref:GNAT family N-acetyltransferase n=1 Tax=Clostridium TaxID=1485 RepID=UPI00293DB242|nr:MULTISPECIES: GNAT family N-acetyltransferase [unclassified Clostridium]MDV4149422.1 GNAT family N-acetyltransferase [Clostridium sp. AL.422]